MFLCRFTENQNATQKTLFFVGPQKPFETLISQSHLSKGEIVLNRLLRSFIWKAEGFLICKRDVEWVISFVLDCVFEGTGTNQAMTQQAQRSDENKSESCFLKPSCPRIKTIGVFSWFLSRVRLSKTKTHNVFLNKRSKVIKAFPKNFVIELQSDLNAKEPFLQEDYSFFFFSCWQSQHWLLRFAQQEKILFRKNKMINFLRKKRSRLN